MEFEGKTVFVAGGASGIGRAASLAFAREGANVTLTYMTSEHEAQEVAREIEGSGWRALAIRADLTRPEQVAGAFEKAVHTFSGVDVLFANAGGLLRRVRCIDTSLEFWNEVFAVNVTSTFLCCQAALRHMEPKRAGVIVTMSSLAAFDGGGPGASHYVASKGAIASYTRALAKEVGPLGIRVNGVAPGLIGTRFHDTFNTAEGRRSTVERTPVRREGKPDDVAETVVFLASERSSFLAGEIIQINGGLGMF